MEGDEFFCVIKNAINQLNEGKLATDVLWLCLIKHNLHPTWLQFQLTCSYYSIFLYLHFLTSIYLFFDPVLYILLTFTAY